MVKNYEYTYLTRQDMTEEAAKSISDKLAESIKGKEGAIVDVPRSYKKRLAYRIKKQDTAYVNTIMFTLDTEKLATFKKETDAMVEILRGLIVSYDPKKLEAEARREPRSAEERIQEAAAAKEAAAQPAAKIKEEKVEEPKIEREEKKEEIKIAEAKEEKKEENEKESEKEEKTPKKTKKEDKAKEKEEKTATEAKPKRRTKIKTELKDIEQKLDEILK